MTKSPDISDALRAAAETADELTPDVVARLLRDAAEVIDTLRVLVGIREDVIDDMPPAGNA